MSGLEDYERLSSYLKDKKRIPEKNSVRRSHEIRQSLDTRVSGNAHSLLVLANLANGPTQVKGGIAPFYDNWNRET